MIYWHNSSQSFHSSVLNSDLMSGGFTAKQSEDMKPFENSLAYVKKFFPRINAVVRLRQVHSTDISIISQPSDELVIIENCDGVITKESNIALCVVVADCVPVLFVDEHHGVIGASHQGWKGTLHGMATKMVSKMVECGASKDTIKVIIGPSINECCYKVGIERVQEYRSVFKEHTSDIVTERDGNFYLNLVKANYIQLLKAGASVKNIDYFPFCTSCDEKRFYSFRRDGDIIGEVMGYIMMKG